MLFLIPALCVSVFNILVGIINALGMISYPVLLLILLQVTPWDSWPP